MFLNSFLVGLGFFVLFLKRKWLFGIFYGLVLFVSHVILVENCLTLPITRQTQLMMALICYVFISDSLNLRMIFILWLSYVLRKKHIFCYFWNDKGTNGRFFRGWRGQSINKIWIEKRKKKEAKIKTNIRTNRIINTLIHCDANSIDLCRYPKNWFILNR